LTAAAASRAAGLDLGQAAAYATRLLVRNWRVYGLLCLILSGLPMTLLDWAIYAVLKTQTWQSLVLAYLGLRIPLAAVSATFAGAAIAGGVVEDRQGRRATAMGCFGAIGPIWRPLLLVALIKAVCLALGAALIAPTLVIAVTWPLVSAVLVVEGGGAIAAFRRSAELTRRSRLQLLGAYLALFVLHALIAAALLAGVFFLSQGIVRLDPRMNWAQVLRPAYSGLSQTASALIGEVWAVALYFQLRTLKEGISPEDAVSLFD
jgi:hypothetical protein